MRFRTAAVLLALAALAAACGGGAGEHSTPGAGGKEGATLSVNSTLDADARDGVLTLREALLLATGGLAVDALDQAERRQVEGSPGAGRSDTIVFDKVAFSSEKPAAIALGSPLPAMGSGTDSIDGMGAVIIDGRDKSLTCLILGSNGNEVKGLRIHNCQTGVLVKEKTVGNIIGAARDGNVLSDNMVGVEVRGGTVIRGNIIGLDATGASRMANEFEGIWVTNVARDTIIGGAAPGEGNVISGNKLFGVSVDGAQGTVLQGNIIGLDASGRKGIANRFGITVQFGAHGTLIGGAADGERNVIAGNNTGILVQHTGTEGNAIRGNYIGTDIDGARGIPNTVDILFLAGGSENVVENNHTLGPLKGP